MTRRKPLHDQKMITSGIRSLAILGSLLYGISTTIVYISFSVPNQVPLLDTGLLQQRLSLPPPKTSWITKYHEERQEVRGGALLSGVSAATAVPAAPKTCRHVDCHQDTECGGLWKGDAVGGDPYVFDRITVVVSHCLHSLDWLSDFLEGFPIDSITIVSKCGKAIEGAPKNATVVRLPNVGRCDHTYANWISQRMAKPFDEVDKAKEVVVFLKDDRSDSNIRQHGKWRSLNDMLRIASRTGFSCSIRPITYQGPSISAFHETSIFLRFHKDSYSSQHGKYDDIDMNTVPFTSQYSSLGEWAQAIGWNPPSELVNVCYGGTFAVTMAQIRKQKASVWYALEKSLERADNIEEGHFAERAWAGLLSDPLKEHQISALRSYSNGNPLQVRGALLGTLVKSPHCTDWDDNDACDGIQDFPRNERADVMGIKIHVGDRVEANWQLEGEYYGATVSAVCNGGKRITVQYDDDGTFETLRRVNVRFAAGFH